MSNQSVPYGSTTAGPIPFLLGMYNRAAGIVQDWLSEQHQVTRRVLVGALLAVALVAFELFNFDTTEYALEDLLGPVGFAGVRWATILAIALCSIDFAGLARLITPDPAKSAVSDGRFLKPTWLLLVAWLLGGGMNAIMTWWAVTLALMGHELGNEVLTREQLLRIVPVFVAVLLWVTRILIISAVSSAADRAVAQARRQTSHSRLSGSRRARSRQHAVPVRTYGGRTASAGPAFLTKKAPRSSRSAPPSGMPQPVRSGQHAPAPVRTSGNAADVGRRFS